MRFNLCGHLEPSPPGFPYVAMSGSRWTVVSWAPPRKPNGKVHYYLLYVQAQSLQQRKEDAYRIVNVTRRTTNVTILNPFSNYSIRVTAVTIRRHDGKVLIGRNSRTNYFTTNEDGNVAILCLVRNP